MHQLPVQVQVLAHDRRVNRVDLDNVIPIVNAILR
jgi:hypothetical protein